VRALALIALVAGGAFADEASNREDARKLFLAGRQAYQDGRLDVAESSFDAAYNLEPLPALLFNLAQTYRKQFLISADPGKLKRAVESYRKYLSDAPTGPNRELATQALADLTPILARSAPEPSATNAPAAPVKTELMVVTEAERGTVALDGKPAAPAPLLAAVEPGAHRALVEAPGYFPDEIKLTAVEGRLIVGEARLKAKPGRIEVAGKSGAHAFLDGRALGPLPLAAVEVPAGPHLIGLAQNGREPVAREVVVERDRTTRFSPSMHDTAQRRAVRWMGLATGLAAAFTIAAAGVWGAADSSASSLLAQDRTSGLTVDQVGEYNSDRARRDDWRLVTSISIGVTGALALVTGGLYLFDRRAPSTGRDGSQ
jgi:hypothetical protein